jgi:hypothetical protein
MRHPQVGRGKKVNHVRGVAVHRLPLAWLQTILQYPHAIIVCLYDVVLRREHDRVGSPPAGQGRRRPAGNAAGDGRGWRLVGLPLAFHALGRRGESDAALAALKDKYAGDSAYQIAEVHAFRGEADLAFEWLERAYAQRDSGVTNIKGDRLLRGLVGDPRYKAFLRKLKLPE